MSDIPNALLWSDDLLIGHEQIDADHREVFNLLHRLWSDAPPSRVDTFAAIIVYLTNHFALEEKLMHLRGMDADYIQRHEAEHFELQSFLLKYSHRFLDFHDVPPDRLTPLAMFIQEELIPHIRTFDVQLREGIIPEKV